ncbi:MAG: antibiotic biosynthesis monooxygenase [Kangiellaceae bacterium]|nr:antibiotic biosynthesis monooxygenase [Kangiellaceae bacterium]
MYIISGEFKVKAEYKEELIAMSLELIPQSLQESGCLSYGFYENQSALGNFLFFERWENRESISEHFEKSYFQNFASKFPQMIDGQASIEIHQVSATEHV